MMQNKEYLITVTGTQEIDGDKDKIEIMTTGKYTEKDNHKYITYNEYDNENPNEITKTTIDLSKELITIKRVNDLTTTLILEKNSRHQCHYNTPMGEIVMGVYTEDIEENLSKEGGDLIVKYQIDFFTGLVSKNIFHINLKEKE